MARSILVLILAAVPALAQYNANTYNVRPSGGSVGQVCFYETAANGSNKVCLAAPSSISADATYMLSGPPFADATVMLSSDTAGGHIYKAYSDTSGVFFGLDFERYGGTNATPADMPTSGNLMWLRAYGRRNGTLQEAGGIRMQADGATGNYPTSKIAFTVMDSAGTKFNPLTLRANGELQITDSASVAAGGLRFNGTNLQWSDDLSSWNNFSSGGGYWSRTGSYTYLTNAGDSVGINTSTPTYQFTVESATYTAGERFLFGARAADGSVSVVAGYRADGATGTAGILRAGGNKPLDLGTTGTPQAIRIEDGGNVGIGTTSPGALLHVDGLVLADSGDFAPTGGTGNYVQTRKLELVDGNGGDLFFDARAFVHATSGQRYMEFRDNAGTPLVQFWRQEAGSVAVDYAQWYVDMIPDLDGGQAIGITGRYWGSAAINTVTANQLTPKSIGNSDIGGTGSAFGDAYVSTLWNTNFRIDSGGGTDMNFEGHLLPWTNEGHNLGEIGAEWDTVFARRFEAHDGTHQRIVLNDPGAGSNAGSAITVKNASGTNVFSLSYGGTTTVTNLTVTGTCTGCGSGALPVVDTTSIVEGSSDGTKEVRIEADGITTGTVRVWTAPDADITVAGINLAQTWTATQTMRAIAFSANETYDVGSTSNRADEMFSRLFAAHDGTRTRVQLLSPGAGSDAGSAIAVTNNAGSSVLSVSYAGSVTAAGSLTFGASSSLVQGSTTRIDGSGNAGFLSLAINGTTRLNLSGAWSGGSFLPSADASYDSGSTSARFANYYASTSYVIYDGTYTRFSASGGSLIGRNASGTTQWTISTTNGTMEVLNWYIANGQAGITATKTVRDSAGTGNCTLVFTGGLLTGGTC